MSAFANPPEEDEFSPGVARTKRPEALFYQGGNGRGSPKTRRTTAKNAIRHPNLVQLLDYFRHRSSPCFFLVFELAELDLSVVCKLAPETVRSFAVQIILGLEELHSKYNIMHRDLKPSNLLLGRDGLLKIADIVVTK